MGPTHPVGLGDKDIWISPNRCCRSGQMGFAAPWEASPREPACQAGEPAASGKAWGTTGSESWASDPPLVSACVPVAFHVHNEWSH